MKIYIAHNWEARFWLREDVVPLLESAGHEVTSSWIKIPLHSYASDTDASITDLADLERADALALFGEDYMAKKGRGKWVELGFALARDKRVILVGETSSSCMFCSLIRERVDSYTDLPEVLSNESSGENYYSRFTGECPEPGA